MTTQAIRKEYWPLYFNLLSKISQGRQVLLELVGNEIGDQIEEDWILMEDLYFVSETDTLYVRTPYLEHPIISPRSIMVQEDGMIRTIGIRDEDGDLQIIHFRDPLMIEGR